MKVNFFRRLEAAIHRNLRIFDEGRDFSVREPLQQAAHSRSPEDQPEAAAGSVAEAPADRTLGPRTEGRGAAALLERRHRVAAEADTIFGMGPVTTDNCPATQSSAALASGQAEIRAVAHQQRADDDFSENFIERVGQGTSARARSPDSAQTAHMRQVKRPKDPRDSHRAASLVSGDAHIRRNPYDMPAFLLDGIGFGRMQVGCADDFLMAPAAHSSACSAFEVYDSEEQDDRSFAALAGSSASALEHISSMLTLRK